MVCAILAYWSRRSRGLRTRSTYDPDATVANVGASLSWGLIKNHAFIDGNKRIGLGALAVFLRANGWVLTCSVAEETGMVLRASASEITEAEWTAWVVRSVAPSQ